MNRQMTICLFLLTALTTFSLEARGFCTDSKNMPLYISAGIGIEGVTVGHSTMNTVVAKYGNKFSLVEHKQYSYEIRYEDLGLSFWYKYADPDKKIFSIAVSAPCHGFTSRSIVVGESKLKDVFNAYGKTESLTTTADESWFFEYPGIAFHI